MKWQDEKASLDLTMIAKSLAHVASFLATLTPEQITALLDGLSKIIDAQKVAAKVESAKE